MSPANTRTYPLTTHSRLATDRCRLRWIVGIATLVTLLSREVIKVARLTATSVHRFRGPVPGIAVSVLEAALRSTCTSFLYYVHVLGTAWLVRCIVVNRYGNHPGSGRGAHQAQQEGRGRRGACPRRRQR